MKLKNLLLLPSLNFGWGFGLAGPTASSVSMSSAWEKIQSIALCTLLSVFFRALAARSAVKPIKMIFCNASGSGMKADAQDSVPDNWSQRIKGWRTTEFLN